MKQLSEEEKAKRLAAMQNAADETDLARENRLANARANTAKEKEAEKAGKTNGYNATFLKDMRHQVYNVHEDTLQDRLKQNRHYSQRGSDQENGFMKK